GPTRPPPPAGPAASGAREAFRAAGELHPRASRSEVIDAAARLLTMQQRYDTAREMFAETGTIAQTAPAFAMLLAKLAAHPPIKTGTADPRSAVFEALEALTDPLRKTSVFWDAALERTARTALRRWAQSPTHRPGGKRCIADAIQSMIAVQIEGDAGLWRAAIDLPGQHGHLYVALDRGVAKLIGASDLASAVARYVLATATDAKGEARA